jgi:hypothetical protein
MMTEEEIERLIAAAIRPLEQELSWIRQELQRLGGGAAPQPSRPEIGTPFASDVVSDASQDLWERLSQLPVPSEFSTRFQQALEPIRTEVIPSRAAAFAAVELIELVEEEKLQSDLDLPFFGLWDELQTQLLDALQLESLVAQSGDRYSSPEQIVVRTARGGERDTIERCLRCGFKFQGQLLRKAEVSIFV